MAKNNNPGRILKGTKSQPSLKGASGVWTLDEALQYHRANQWPQPNLFQPVSNSLKLSAAKLAYMTRLGPRGGASTTWTWSGWVKPTMYDNGAYNNVLFYAEDPAGNISMVSFEQSPNSPAYRIYIYHNGQNYETTQVFRDPSAWYHITAIADTTNSTAGDRLRLYINGSRVTSFASAATVTQGANGGAGRPGTTYWIGKQGPSLARYGDSYLAEINFVDGYALQPTMFGQFDTNNTWVPVAYTGTYGTNGFYLPFTNAQSSQTLGYDASLNGTPTYNADQDPYRSSVALHLTGNGPAGGQNNSFADSSTNNYKITATGTTAQGSFSPFPFNTTSSYNPTVHGGSSYVGVASSYLSLPASTPLYLNTATWTVEFWMYPTSYVNGQGVFGASNGGGAQPKVAWQVNGASNISLYVNGSPVVTTTLPTLNVWTHVVVTAYSGTAYVYYNGAQQSSGAISTQTGLTSNFQLFTNGEGATSGMYGYLSSFVVYNVAKYTASFTPMMRPFGTLTNNLISASEQFTYSGYWATSNATLVTSAVIAPDGTPSATTISSTGSPGYLYGTQTATVASYTFSTYAKAGTTNSLRLDLVTAGYTLGASITFDLSTGTAGSPTHYGSSSGFTSSITSVGNGWYRCSMTGTLTATTWYNQYGVNNGLTVSVWGSQLETGGTATNYTPTPANYSTAPALLLNFANAAVVDSAGAQNFTTVSGATITNSSKYGSGALTFNGSSDYLLAPAMGSNGFGLNNFTIEHWVNWTVVGNGNFVTASPGNVTGAYYWQYYSGQLQFGVCNTGSVVTYTWAPATNTWYHLCVMRQGTSYYLYINGQQIQAASYSQTWVDAATYVGYGGAGYLNGKMDDIRITNGVVRYNIAGFTPPARALPETGGKSFVTTNINAGVVKSFVTNSNTTTINTSWTAPSDVTQIEVLVVAGGGGGGVCYGGGGGGGGLIYNNAYPVTPGQTYSIQVGRGGTNQVNVSGNGGQGTNSQFGNLIAIGGGYGGGNCGNTGGAGGSGGGGSSSGSAGVAGGSGTPAQGFAGCSCPANAGGGGGAAGAGGATNSSQGANGLQFGTSGTPTYYAGGGTGGQASTTAGGLGGGGTGGTALAAGVADGTVNTGGGGGGSIISGTGTSGVGGSGIVIIRYTTTAVGNTSDSTTDNLVDSPTLYGHDTGAGGEVVGNYATFNPLSVNSGGTINSSALINGNLQLSTATANTVATSTIGLPLVASGQFYAEFILTVSGGGSPLIGITTPNSQSLSGGSPSVCYRTNGQIQTNGSTTTTVATFTTGDLIAIAVDMTTSGGQITFYKNSVSVATVTGLISQFAGAGNFINFGCQTNAASTTTFTANFGQRAWAYAPPAGFNALTTKNLPRPAVGSAAATPNQYFDTVLYTGTGSSLAVSSLNFQPDFVWIKNRGASTSHILVDSIRGVNNVLVANGTAGDQNLPSYVSSLTSNGFTVGTGSGGTPADVNTNTNTYVAWCWRANGAAVSNTAGTITSQVSANTTSGFSIVTYTGNGSGTPTIGHGLGVAPSMVIVKTRSTANGWVVYHQSLGATQSIILSGTNAASTQTDWGNTTPTSTVFYVNGGNNNISAATYVAYCWAPIAGYSAFGSYTGNGSADGPFVYLGFRPKFVMVKAYNDTTNWAMFDTSRDPSNVSTHQLYPNLSNAEDANTIDLLSNGFKLRQSGTPTNGSGDTFIYAAFAEKPFGNANGTAR